MTLKREINITVENVTQLIIKYLLKRPMRAVTRFGQKICFMGQNFLT